jgi:hypothetical protein
VETYSRRATNEATSLQNRRVRQMPISSCIDKPPTRSASGAATTSSAGLEITGARGLHCHHIGLNRLRRPYRRPRRPISPERRQCLHLRWVSEKRPRRPNDSLPPGDTVDGFLQFHTVGDASLTFGCRVHRVYAGVSLKGRSVCAGRSTGKGGAVPLTTFNPYFSARKEKRFRD